MTIFVAAFPFYLVFFFFLSLYFSYLAQTQSKEMYERHLLIIALYTRYEKRKTRPVILIVGTLTIMRF